MQGKVLFLLPYPLHHAPSQRYRVEAYFDLLNQQNIVYDVHVFFNNRAWKTLYQRGHKLSKVAAVLHGCLSRLGKLLFNSFSYDYVFVHREAAPLGPPIFEWLLTKLLRKKMIFDFDDAIWIPNVSAGNKMVRSIKAFWKFSYICRWAHIVSAGNAFLAHKAAIYNPNVIINPTCIDLQGRHPAVMPKTTSKLPVIGWTGSHSTLKYLSLIHPVLLRLEREYDFIFLVICDVSPSFSMSSLKFTPWQARTEVQDLSQIDIGIMPLEPDAWSEGKCGFKIIQYLSLGIPAVASPIGVNKIIIEDGVNGYLCADENAWYEHLKKLLLDTTLRHKLGKQGFAKIKKQYSLESNALMFLSLFTN